MADSRSRGSLDARVLEGDWQPDGLLVLISFPTVETRTGLV